MSELTISFITFQSLVDLGVLSIQGVLLPCVTLLASQDDNLSLLAPQRCEVWNLDQNGTTDNPGQKVVRSWGKKDIQNNS